MEAETRDVARDGHDAALVAVADAHEHRSALGKLVADGKLGLGERAREVLRNAHDLARRLHLGPEDGIGAREAPEGHDGLLAR